MAEESYKHAVYMVPNRMTSRFDLLNYYIRQKDTIDAVRWANSILNMPVKVPSMRTENMLKKTRLLLQELKR